LIDAEAEGLSGEAAFQKILSWKSGNFETLPAEPSRTRTVFKSYNGLLLESAQALDELRNQSAQGKPHPEPSPLADVSKLDGVEFVLAMKADEEVKPTARGLENPDRMAGWARETLVRFRSLGERLNAGPIEQIEGFGPQRHVALAQQGDTEFCVGWKHSLTPTQLRDMMKRLLALWAS